MFPLSISRKEVIHEQLPLPMPCYDFTLVIDPALTLRAAHASYKVRKLKIIKHERFAFINLITL